MKKPTLLLLLSAASCCVEEITSSSPHNRGRSRGGGGIPPRRRQQHPASMWSQHESPNLDMYIDNNSGGSPPSYYERNDINPPPLISRKTRRQLQSSSTNNTADDAATSDLEIIIEEAKLGNDALSTLRRDLIFNTYYDRHVYPFDYAWYGQADGSRTGVPVELDINFHRVFSVDTINPVLDLVVWFRLQWADPRLTWDPTEYGNMTKVWFWIGDGSAGGETSEIWTPDIELWNLETGISDTLDDAYAIVSYDGSIYWSRPGHLKPTCKFYGLSNFPFDELTCMMEFGSWGYSGKYMRLVKGGSDGDGFSVGGSDTAGSSYNEFSFAKEDPITCIEHVYPPYPASPEEDWPVMKYNVTISRSWQPYARGYLLLQVMLNVVGFSAFWLPPSCGERMSLLITAMLAAVASELVVASNLPAAAELTWFQKFSIFSLIYAFISLIESVAVLYFFYKKTDNIIPHWYSFARDWYLVRQASKGKAALTKRGSDLVDSISHGVKEVVNKRGLDMTDGNEDGFEENDKGTSKVDTAACKRNLNTEAESNGSFFRDGKKDDTIVAAEPKENPIDVSNASLSVGDIDEGDTTDFGAINIVPKANANGRDNPFAASFVSALSDDGELGASSPLEKQLYKDPRSAAKPRVKFTVHEEDKNEDDSDGNGDESTTSNKRESLKLRLNSRATMMTESQSVSMIVPRDADDFADDREIEVNREWKKISVQIDDFCRVWIPLTYFIILPILFAQATKSQS